MRQLIPAVVVPLVIVLGGLWSLTATRRAGRPPAVDIVRLVASIVCVGAAITLGVIWIHSAWMR